MKNAAASRRVSQNAQPRLPKHYPWIMLSALAEGNLSTLSKEDQSLWHSVIRSRSLEKLLDLSELWGPQSMAPQGLRVEEFYTKYQLSSFLKKFPFPGDARKRREVALAGFLQAEEQCAAFNNRTFARVTSGTGLPTHYCTLGAMRVFIRKVLGEIADIDEIYDGSRHGPGASLCTSKGRVTTYFKYADLPYSVTDSARPHARALIESDPRWCGAIYDFYRNSHSIPMWAPVSPDEVFDSIFTRVEGNRITFVRKDARKDRPIAIEPRMNVMLQLGVDRFIRRRLKRFGCDLDSQTKNQVFALRGSTARRLVDSGFATLDLSAASDTVSLKLCELLLPPWWFNLLMELRSPFGVLEDGSILKYEKISSMGNGFTFALESLIFLAATFAAGMMTRSSFDLRSEVAVYGDDIIAPLDTVPRLREIIRFCGFKLNEEKSFWTTPFRESCGSDFYMGTVVRPVTLTSEVNDVKSLFAILNRCKYVHYRVRSEDGLDFSYQALQTLLMKWVPANAQALVGPPSRTEFDTYLHIPRSETRKYGIRYKSSVFHYRRLVTVPIPKQGPQFFFRKLMFGAPAPAGGRSEWIGIAASLGIGDLSSPHWEKSKVWDPTASGGSVFTVSVRNALTVRVVHSQSSFWAEDYSAR